VYPPGYNELDEWDEEAYEGEDRLTRQNKHFIGLIICVQVPFTFFNLYLPLTQPYSVCMDQAQGMSFLILRPWLLSMGIAEIVLMAGMLLPLLFFKGRCFSYNTMTNCWACIGMLALLKTFIWAITELELFSQVIVHYCSGGVFAYGVVMTVLHSFFLIGVCCCSGTSGYRSF
jgi:hypothetical protein